MIYEHTTNGDRRVSKRRIRAISTLYCTKLGKENRLCPRNKIEELLFTIRLDPMATERSRETLNDQTPNPMRVIPSNWHVVDTTTGHASMGMTPDPESTRSKAIFGIRLKSIEKMLSTIR